MSDYGQEIVDRGLDRLKGSWEYEDKSYNLLVEDISYPDLQLVQQYAAVAGQTAAIQDEAEELTERELQARVDELEETVEGLDDFSFEEEDEDRDFILTLVGHKLIKPEVDPSTTSVDKLRALVEGMMQTWRESEETAQAREEMPLEGNA